MQGIYSAKGMEATNISATMGEKKGSANHRIRPSQYQVEKNGHNPNVV
jgi:hypothetical protein